MRGKNTFFKKNAIVKAPGKLKQIYQVKRYYIFDRYDVDINPEHYSYYVNLFWLPYRTIKRQLYYQIKRDQYIKCINVKAINKEHSLLFTDQATITVRNPESENQHYIYAKEKVGNNDKNAFKLPKYKKLVVDNTIGFNNEYAESYHIKGTTYYIYAGDIVKRPRHVVYTHPAKSYINGKFTIY